MQQPLVAHLSHQSPTLIFVVAGIPKVMGSTTLTIKCQLDGSDLRRRTVELPSSGLTLASLNSVVRELFQQSDTTTFKVVYTDEDGDAITIGCDADVAEAVRCATVSGKPMLRLRASLWEVSAPTPTPQAPAPKPATPASEPTAPNQTIHSSCGASKRVLRVMRVFKCSVAG